jgi:hypothetical protein
MYYGCKLDNAEDIFQELFDSIRLIGQIKRTGTNIPGGVRSSFFGLSTEWATDG